MRAGGNRGLIFDIQGHSIHDGPGTRTLVFLSGCLLRCSWCCNPEGLVLRQRLMYRAQLCKQCPARCLPACSKRAVRRSQNGDSAVLFDRQQCECCETMDCLNVCYTGALQRSGIWYTVDELMRVFNRDRYYWGPEGGITLTGGEPLLQQEFVVNLLQCCHDAYITACVETSAYVSRAVLQAILPFIEWLFVDLKHMDSRQHQEGTGVPNEPILENIRWLASTNWPGRLIIRVPVVPGFNDGIANAQATAEFLAETGVTEINLLPFHRLGASKYTQLGIPYPYREQAGGSPQGLEMLASIYRGKQIRCQLGSETSF